MSEFNYLKEKRRYLDSIGRQNNMCLGARCKECILRPADGDSCTAFEVEHPEEATELIRKWAEEHPVVTNRDKFEEVFGFAPNTEGCLLRGCTGCKYNDIEYCGQAWWDDEYKGKE